MGGKLEKGQEVWVRGKVAPDIDAESHPRSLSIDFDAHGFKANKDGSTLVYVHPESVLPATEQPQVTEAIETRLIQLRKAREYAADINRRLRAGEMVTMTIGEAGVTEDEIAFLERLAQLARQSQPAPESRWQCSQCAHVNRMEFSECENCKTKQPPRFLTCLTCGLPEPSCKCKVNKKAENTAMGQPA
jgi:hypothetical protein